MSVGSDCMVSCCLENFFLCAFNNQCASFLTGIKSAVNNLSCFRHDCLLNLHCVRFRLVLVNSPCSPCLRGDKSAENHFTTETLRTRRTWWDVKLGRCLLAFDLLQSL